MDDTTETGTGSTAGSVPTASLYAAAIAIVSGGYSVVAATAGTGAMSGTLTAGGWVMFFVGIAAVAHGVALLTPAATRLGEWSGPLMIGYAVVMLLNRAAVPMGSTAGMGDMGGNVGAGGMLSGYMGTMGPGGGVGMVALAILMLASGVVMTVRSDDRMSGG